jgi:hypothetical protein
VTAEDIVGRLLAANGRLRAIELLEASVRRPTRGRVYVATFTGPEAGRQVWRSTRLTGREQALAVAKEWEIQARQQRQALGAVSGKPTIRVRHKHRVSGVESGPLTQREVALLLGLSERGVREIERVTFHNDDTGFAVIKAKVKGHRGLVTVAGSLPSVSAGEWV